MTELVLIGAEDEQSLVAEAKRLAGFLDRVPDVPIADVAYTCALRKGPSTLAVIAPDAASLRTRLVSAVSRLEGGARFYQSNGAGQGFTMPTVICGNPLLSCCAMNLICNLRCNCCGGGGYRGYYGGC